jgi:hypothetical protein
MGMQRHHTRLPSVILPSGRVGRLSLLLEIQTSDDLRITSHCDNYSLLKDEKAFHTRDIDSSSWFTNPDHDVIMILIALKINVASEVLEDLRAVDKPTELYPLPAHLRDGTLTNEFPRVRYPSGPPTARQLDRPHCGLHSLIISTPL